MEKGFREMLTERQKKVNSLVCVGLDPIPEKLPKFFAVVGDPWPKISTWMRDIVDATAPYTSMYKPQRAHYEAIENGIRALNNIINHIHTNHPEIPVFLDCKRGDIDRTQQRYGVAHFELDGADGINFSPYMGKSCMEALVGDSSKGKALVGLCYTSNPPAREVQDVKLEDGRPFWEFIAKKTLQWANELGVVENAGLVMAAAYEYPKDSGNVYSDHLKRCRKIVGNKMWFLIPGIGTQGGFVEETIRASYRGPGSIAINSSSAIIFASDGDDYAEAAAKKAKELRDQIRAAM
jgi:orotidine-5'-phosphate decarboxylase